MAPRKALATMAARRSAPGVGGIKLPMRVSLSVWGARADLAMRVRVLSACHARLPTEGDPAAREFMRAARKQALSEGITDPRVRAGLCEWAAARRLASLSQKL